MSESGKAAGGVARAAALSSKERKDAAKKAADARWSSPPPKKVVSGSIDRPLRIGTVDIECYVLEDGTRVINQSSMLEALGRSRRPKVLPDDDPNLPPLLQMKAIRPYLTPEMIESATPVRFVTPTGVKSGYRAELLPDLCEAWLSARSAGELRGSQLPTAAAAEIIVRGLARVGIIALVDEATGYQDVRAKDALAKILEKWVAEELQPWVKTFPVDFYKEMFRLRGLEFNPDSVSRPGYFGHLTNNVVYKRVAPGVFDEIKAQRAKDEKKRKAKFHQQLSQEVGHPKLKEHLVSVTTIMKLSDDWEGFIQSLDRVHPMIDPNMPPELWDENTPGL